MATRSDHIINYLKTKNTLLEKADLRSANLMKLLERMDLDRQIVFKEKIDVLLEEKFSVVSDAKLKIQINNSLIDEKKMRRKMINNKQKRIYNNVLTMIGYRIHLEKLNRAENNGERI